MDRPVTPASSIPGFAWPSLPGAAGAAMLAMQWQLERSQWWTPAQLRAHQLLQLRNLLLHATESVPRYRDGLRALGMDSVSRLDWDGFARWPVVRKADVQADPGGFLASAYPPEHGRIAETYTTGSTGTPMRVVHTEVSQFFAQALTIREHLLHERDFSLKFAVMKHALDRTSQPGWGLVNMVFPTGPGCAIGVDRDVSEQLDWLLREAPGYLMAYGSHLRALILHSRKAGRKPQGLRQLLCYGEMPPEDLAALAMECWGVPVVPNYSCEEFSLLASRCPGHGHYVVHAENVVLEVLRDDGSACPPGEVGRIVVTGLHNFAMPLIRYELGDYGEPGTACPTGRGLPTLARVAGRRRNMLRHPAGGLRRPTFPGDLWLSVAPFEQVRLVQRELAAIEVQYALPRELTTAEHASLKEKLQDKLGFPFALTFTRVVRVERKASEKFEDFVCLVADDDG
jgi:phenylacetate-CoA ligase